MIETLFFFFLNYKLSIYAIQSIVAPLCTAVCKLATNIPLVALTGALARPQIQVDTLPRSALHQLNTLSAMTLNVGHPAPERTSVSACSHFFNFPKTIK